MVSSDRFFILTDIYYEFTAILSRFLWSERVWYNNFRQIWHYFLSLLKCSICWYLDFHRTNLIMSSSWILIMKAMVNEILSCLYNCTVIWKPYCKFTLIILNLIVFILTLWFQQPLCRPTSPGPSPATTLPTCWRSVALPSPSPQTLLTWPTSTPNATPVSSTRRPLASLLVKIIL